MFKELLIALSTVWLALGTGQAQEQVVVRPHVEAITAAPTTEDEVVQEWTVSAKEGETIATISIALRDTPQSKPDKEGSLVCSFLDQRTCENIQIGGLKLTDPIIVTLKTPVVGRYILRMTTEFEKGGNKGKRLRDVVIWRQPASEQPTVYEIDQMPDLFVTGSWNPFFEGADIRPVFGVRAKSNFLGRFPSVSLTGKLERKAEADSEAQKTFAPLTCFGVEGERMKCESIKFAQFAANATNHIGVGLGDFASAGKHFIKVEVADLVSPPVHSDFEINYRDSGFTAFLLILSGVIIAFLAKKIISESLPDLTRRQKVADAARRLTRFYDALPAPDQHVEALKTWMIGVLLDAAGGLSPNKLTDDDVTLLLQLPTTFDAWHSAYSAANEDGKAGLVKASQELISPKPVTSDALDEFKKSISSFSKTDLEQLGVQQPAAVQDGRSATERATSVLAQLGRQIRSRETLLNLFVIVIATITGLTVLWTSNPVWGQPGDYLTAFLWGAGAKAITDGATGYLDVNRALRESLSG